MRRSTVLVLTIALLGAAPPPLAVGEPFPALVTASARGPVVRLPEDRRGEPFVVLFAFSRGAGEAMRPWALALHRALPSVPIYAVADLSRVPRFVRGFAISQIRNDASRADGPGALLLLTGSNDWSRIVPSGSDDSVAAVAVNAAGSVRCRIVQRLATLSQPCSVEMSASPTSRFGAL